MKTAERLDTPDPYLQAPRQMDAATRPREPLTWEEVAAISEGIAFASQPFKTVIAPINQEYMLGPRGAWILRLIRNGHVYPLDITQVFRVGRSLITAELTRLEEAGLITTRQSATDRRRTELTLTSKGEALDRRVTRIMTDLVDERLAGYSRDEILLCARLLRDMRGEAPPLKNAQPRREA